MRRLPLFVVMLIMTVLSCRSDRGEQLFLINYPPLNFTLPSGIGFPNSWVLSQNVVDSRFEASLQNANVSVDQVSAVGGAFARLTALDGNDFRDLQSVSVRICTVGSALCSEAEEVFFLGDLFGRRNDVLNLTPGFRNVLPLVQSGQFKLEVVLTPAQTTRQSVEARFEYSLEAVE